MDPTERPKQVVRRTHYSMQFACLACRKVFKQLCEYGITEDRARLCPQCGRTMHRMGVAFKAPRLSDTRGWRRVAYIVQRGLMYHANYNGGPFPHGMHALRSNVAKRLQENETTGQKLARRFDKRTP